MEMVGSTRGIYMILYSQERIRVYLILPMGIHWCDVLEILTIS